MGDDDVLAFDINNFRDSLFVVDDSDFGKHAKAVFEVLNLISAVGREYNISLIFITHFNSRLNATKEHTESLMLLQNFSFSNNQV